MAMRIYSQEELDDELIRRKCVEHPELADESGFWWEKSWDGKYFQVPYPEQVENPSGKIVYPDHILDDLIREHNLPDAPTEH